MRPLYSICIRLYILGWMASPNNWRMFWVGTAAILWSERRHVWIPEWVS